MLSVIRFFHEGIQARIRIGDTVIGNFEVCNDLWQGCVIAPTLFNIAMVAGWCDG